MNCDVTFLLCTVLFVRLFGFCVEINDFCCTSACLSQVAQLNACLTGDQEAADLIPARYGNILS